MLDSKKEVRVRLHSATLTGEMLLDGQRIAFRAEIVGPKVEAWFDPTKDGQEVDRWLAFRALDRWIDENLRG
jgi:hypothetical protein